MVLRCFFDGGNKPDSEQYEVLSLAVVCGTENLWKPFDRDWRNFLKKHDAPYLHTTDLVTRNEPYAGWSDKQANKFAVDAIKLAHIHLGRAAMNGKPGRYGMFPFVFAVNLKDFVAARNKNKDMPRRADEIALRQALNECWEWGRDQAAADTYQLVFDQGESFYGYVKQLKDNKTARKDTPFLDKTFITEGNMRLIPALQLADLLAWGVSKLNAKDEDVPRWHLKLRRLHLCLQHIDASVVHMGSPEVESYWRNLKLPNRKVHR